MIIENHLDNRQLLPHRRGQLIHIHAEAPVPRKINHVFSGIRARGADRGAQTIPHRAKAAGGQKCPRLLIFIILRRPHLVLPHIRDDHRIPLCGAVDFLDDKRAGQSALRIAERIFFFQRLHFTHPLRVIQLRKAPVQARENLLQITGHAGVHADIFVDFRRIHVKLQNFRPSRKCFRIPGNPV